LLRITSLLVVATGLLLSAPPARADSCIIRATRTLAESFPGQRIPDAAIELEMDMSDEVLALLTTRDGTVGSLLKRRESLPEWFVAEMKRARLMEKDFNRVSWDSLDPVTQKKLLKSILKARDQDFGENRRIHGLQVRKKVTLRFGEPTLFMGREYVAGDHEIALDGLLLPYVEARGSKSMRDGSGVELHARNSSGAGNLSVDARTLQKGIGIPVTHQHGHVVARRSVGAIPEDPKLEAAIKGDYVRRANLVAEMLAIVEDGKRIWNKEVFGSFGVDEIEEITQALEGAALGDASDVGDMFKLGAVAVYFKGKYDVPGVWGLEVRRIGRTSDPKTSQALLDAIQYGLTQGEYGLSAKQINRWLGSARGDAPAKVAKAWYNQPLDALLDSAPKRIASVMKKRKAVKPQELLGSLANDHNEVKMLLFDWRNDPVVSLDPVLAERILPQQERAIARMLDLKFPMSKRAERKAINAIMRDFLVDSGLYDAHLGAMGMQRVPKNPRGPRI
jgi:hypothetical protein